jgi:hypothetical protein
MGVYRGSGIGTSKGGARLGPAAPPLRPGSGAIGDSRRRSDQSTPPAVPPPVMPQRPPTPVGTSPGILGSRQIAARLVSFSSRWLPMCFPVAGNERGAA